MENLHYTDEEYFILTKTRYRLAWFNKFGKWPDFDITYKDGVVTMDPDHFNHKCTIDEMLEYILTLENEANETK